MVRKCPAHSPLLIGCHISIKRNRAGLERLNAQEECDLPRIETSKEMNVREQGSLLVLGGLVGKARHGRVEEFPACSS